MLQEGTFTVTPTPFTDDGSIDLGSVSAMTSQLLELGVDGLLVLGVMGEADRLLDDERDAVLRRFVETANADAKIIAGTNHPSSIGSLTLTQRAEAAGADAVMVSPPRLGKPNLEAVRRFYETVAEGTDIPIVVQDHPAASGVHLPVDFIADLAADIDQIVALKLEDPPTPPKVAAVLDVTAGQLPIFGGLGGVKLLEELQAGAGGTMTGFAYPEVLKEIVQSKATGDDETARSLFLRWLPLLVFEAQPYLSLPVRKMVYEHRGFIASSYVRSPSTAVDTGTEQELWHLVDMLESTQAPVG